MTAIAIATFGEEGPFLRARLRAIGEGRRVIGEWTPFATAALATPTNGAPDGTRGIIVWVIAAGLVGLVSLYALESWSAVLAYPFDEGGRPYWSWQAFVPPVVEFGALTAGIGGVVRLFRNAGLTRLHHPAFDFPEVARASQDAFVLAIACDAGDDGAAAIAMLAGAGAEHSRLVTA